MREEKRGPGLRGNILVEEGDAASTGTANAPADPSAAADQPAADQPAAEQATEAGRADIGATVTGAEAKPEPESFAGTIREDAGTHATGPNPVVTDAVADPTGPNPVVRAELPAEPEGSEAPADPEGKAEAAAEPGAAPAEPEAAVAEPEAAPAEPGPAEAEAEAGQPGGVVEPAHIASPVPASTRAPAVYRPPAPGPEPSWGKVLATTISLWASRRFGRGRSRTGTVAVYGATEPPVPSSRWGGVRWPLVVFVLLLVILALVGLQLSGALDTGSPSRPAAGSGNAGRGGSLAEATAARNSAASWIAQQVTSSDQIACDPLMCSILQSDGVTASRLTPMLATTPDPLGTDVVVATSSIRSQFGSRLVSEYAPELIASFGSGTSRVDVRAVANYGAAAFKASERADLAARKSAGADLLKNGFHVPAHGASQIRAGQVDSRLLVTLAALKSQRQVQVSSFGDTSPGGPVLYRQVTIVNAAGQTGSSALAADLKQVQTQRNSYLPAHARIVHLANSQSALRIEFGAPDQPGLLSGGNS